MNVRPLSENRIIVIVQRLAEGEPHVGGIIVPDTAAENARPQQGKVIAAGNGTPKDGGKRLPLDVKAGDRILFGKSSGQKVKLDDEEYLIMREDEILAVIVPGPRDGEGLKMSEGTDPSAKEKEPLAPGGYATDDRSDQSSP